jgi:hypothetical protein
MIRLLAFFAAWGLTLSAQTTVHLRYGQPGSSLTIIGATNANPIEIKTSAPHAFAVGQTVWIQGVEGNFAANGARTVAAITGLNSFTIGDRNGAAVAGSGAYDKTSDAVVGATRPVALRPHPRVWLDGPEGELTTGLAAKAVPSNPAWSAVVAAANKYASTYANIPAGPDGVSTNAGTPLSAAALRWLVTRDATSLSLSKFLLKNVEMLMATSVASGGHAGCDEAVSQCGPAGAATDYAVFNLQHIAAAYSIVRSELTAAERRMIADKLFNDNQYAYETPQAQCTNQAVGGAGTVTMVNGSAQLTYSDDAMDTLLAAGDYIWVRAPANFIARVSAVNSNTNTVTLAKSATSSQTGLSFLYVKPWQTGNCGYLWKLKHHGYWPGPMGTFHYFGGSNTYPTRGGNYASYVHNHVISRAYHAMAISIALADDDPRAAEMLEMSFNFFFDRVYTTHKSYWSGPAQVDEGYLLTRVGPSMTMSMPLIMNSLGVDLYSDGWLKNLLTYFLYALTPHRVDHPRYGPPNGNGQNLAGTSYISLFASLWMYRGTPEAAYGYKFLRDLAPRSDYSPVWTAAGLLHAEGVAFVLSDPSAPSASYDTALPLQVLYNASPAPLFPRRNTSVMISRTGWPTGRAPSSDTWTWLYAPDQHQTGLVNIFGTPGNYGLAKNVWLIGDDNGPDNCSPTASCYGSDLDKTSYIEIGGGNQLTRPIGNGAVLHDVEITRYKGDGENRFAYAMADLTGVYKETVGPTRVHRHFLDLKKAGTQQFLLIYDDVQTATPQMKRTFLQYSQNGGTGEGNTSFDGATRTIVSKGLTSSVVSKVLLPVRPVTFTDLGLFRCPGYSPCPGGAGTKSLLIAKNASPSDPYLFESGAARFTVSKPAVVTLSGTGTGNAYFYFSVDGQLTVGHNGLIFSSLGELREESGVTAFPEGTFPIAMWSASNGVWAAEGVYSGATLSSTAGQTRRFLVSGGSTVLSEFLVVHMPGLSSSPVLPPTTLLTTAGLNFHGVQIEGDDPKVVLFARGGVFQHGAGFVTTHGGTAQILVTGLAAGTYDVFRNGAPVASGVAVENRDNTLYFESTSGSFVVLRTGGTAELTILGPDLPKGIVGEPYTSALRADGGTAPYGWSIGSGTLPEGMTLSNGSIQGTPMTEGEYTVTLVVTDASQPPQTAQKALTLTVNAAPPPSLTITATAVASDSAVVSYGMPGLDANQFCTLRLSAESSMDPLTEELSDGGGAAMREYVFGQFAPLAGSTTYYASATCGPATATTQFTTTPAEAAQANRLRVSLSAPAALHPSSVLIEYGATPALGSQVKIACTAECSTEVAGLPRGVVYVRRTYLDAEDRVVARSGAHAARGAQ